MKKIMSALSALAVIAIGSFYMMSEPEKQVSATNLTEENQIIKVVNDIAGNNSYHHIGVRIPDDKKSVMLYVGGSDEYYKDIKDELKKKVSNALQSKGINGYKINIKPW